jgi:hypothetical protein
VPIPVPTFAIRKPQPEPVFGMSAFRPKAVVNQHLDEQPGLAEAVEKLFWGLKFWYFKE